MKGTPTTSSPAPPAAQADRALERQLRDMNEALLVSSVRQHELAEQVEKANAVVRESEQRLRFVLDSMPQKIYTATPDGEMDYFNPQWTEFTGLPFEQIKGWGWTKCIHADDAEENIRRWKHSIHTGEPFELEHRVRRRDGVYRWHVSRAYALRDADRRVSMWVGSNTDVDDLKRTQDTLRETDRRKTEFLATLAHELRNPLAPIAHGAEVLKMTRLGGEAKQVTVMMERQVGQMVRLIDDLVDASRISRGKLDLRRERVEVEDVIDAAVEAARPGIEEAGHKLTVEEADEPLVLHADAARLTQVVVNLLNNAARYTPRSGRITLTTEAASGEAVIRVRDNGIGIAPEMLAGIFEMFMQGESVVEHGRMGLGIGLTLAKTLVEMHGGTIEARSEGRGLGSEFTVRIPRVVESGRDDDEPARDAEPVAVSRLRVQVVDDSVAVGDAFVMLLKMMGHHVRLARSGAEALEMVAAEKPDVLFSDVSMPGMSGHELARRLRQLPELRDLVMVAVTGYGQPEDRDNALEAGFNHHMVKPPTSAALQALFASIGSGGVGGMGGGD